MENKKCSKSLSSRHFASFVLSFLIFHDIFCTVVSYLKKAHFCVNFKLTLAELKNKNNNIYKQKRHEKLTIS